MLVGLKKLGLVVAFGAFGLNAEAAAPRWGHPPPCLGQCAAQRALNAMLTGIQSYGSGSYKVYRGTVTTTGTGRFGATALGTGSYYGAQEGVYVSWTQSGYPRLRVAATVDDNGNPTGADLSLTQSDGTVSSESQITLPDAANFAFGQDNTDQYYWSFAWFTMDRVYLNGTSPGVVSGRLDLVPTVNLDTALALESRGLWQGPALAGHLIRGAQAATLPVAPVNAVACAGGTTAHWSATITIPNNDLKSATATPVVLSACQ